MAPGVFGVGDSDGGWFWMICSRSSALCRSSALFLAWTVMLSVAERPSVSVTVREILCVPDISNL